MTRHPIRKLLTAALTLASASLAAADLTQSCETELALSALPDRLRAGATVYVQGDNGYEVAQDGNGAFSCIVERNHQLALIPQCMDQAGASSILPALIYKSDKVMAGEDPAVVKADYLRKLAAGEFTAPERPGVSYMISAFNRIHIEARGGRIDVAPHVMFYAPGLSDNDIGGSQQDGFRDNRGMPFVLDDGPHGYMISFVEHASESDGVLEACDGQLAAFGVKPMDEKIAALEPEAEHEHP